MELTRRAVDLDPYFARALALRALCIQHLRLLKADDAEASAEALLLAHAALAESSDDKEAATLADTVISSMGGSIEAALSASQRALALHPNGFLAHMHNGWIQCIAGNPRRHVHAAPGKRIPTAAVALVDLGRIDAARERIAQLLSALAENRIRPEFVHRHNRDEATAEAWIAALRTARLPDRGLRQCLAPPEGARSASMAPGVTLK